MNIPFNKMHITNSELSFIKDVIADGNLSGDGKYSRKCQSFFEESFGFRKCLMTSSCTDALEMAAILLDVEQGDEIIMPAYTFVSTANAFVLRGAKPVFCDSRADHPNMDESLIESLITRRTKAIVVVHYAGMACKMDVIMDIAQRHHLIVIEDAAQAVGSYFIDDSGGKHPLGGIGHLGTISFDGQKNVSCGEGGMLIVNDGKFIGRAEVIWQKGTNRKAFYRGEVDKYGWVDIGSNFAMSELNAAFLFAQLQNLPQLIQERQSIWETYAEFFQSVETDLRLPYVPDWSTNNGHIFFLVCSDEQSRTRWLQAMKSQSIGAIFHYQNLSKSSMGGETSSSTPNCDRYADCLFRLPLYVGLDTDEMQKRFRTIPLLNQP